MKKITIIAILLIASISNIVYAQDMYDALRFSKLDYEGTARSMAMGNAFTAVGGDLGAIAINPAAGSVVKSFQFTITPSLTSTIDNSIYNTHSTIEKRSNFGLSNFGWVGTIPTGRKRGLVSHSFALVSNQVANYTSRSNVMGIQDETSFFASIAANMPEINFTDLTMPDKDRYAPYFDTNAPWKGILAWNTSLMESYLSDTQYIGATENIDEEGYIYLGGPLRQNFYQETSGYNHHITFNYGMNISDMLYLGINMTAQRIWYSRYQEFIEESDTPSLFDTNFEMGRYSFRQNINGVGFNAKFGVIYRPVAGLRIGGSISTPTWTRYTDETYETMEAKVYEERYMEDTPYNTYQYKMTSPFRWNLGVAYTFGNFALISADYESTNYSTTKFVVDRYMNTADIEYFNKQNSEMRKGFKSVHNARVGFEIKPFLGFAIRGGYNYLDYTEWDFNDAMHIATAGVGYNFKQGFSIDVAYRQQCNRIYESYWLYDSDYLKNSTPAVVDSSYLNWKLLLTLGFRF